MLAIDTATEVATVALGDGRSHPLAVERWAAGHVHGERLLTSVRSVLRAGGVALGELGGLVVGTGPGSFTGLRVGLAAAKGLAYGLGIPLVGIESAVALAAGDPTLPSGSPVTVVLPAGPGARYRALVEIGPPLGARLAQPVAVLVRDERLQAPPGSRLLAVDLPEAGREATLAGESARRALGATLLRLGADRLASGTSDDPAELVPVYVVPPRGAADMDGSIAWSPDPA
jgi:tRNA threonylcarbamoyladenosine biosynthesis protein TsaB